MTKIFAAFGPDQGWFVERSTFGPSIVKVFKNVAPEAGGESVVGLYKLTFSNNETAIFNLTHFIPFCSIKVNELNKNFFKGLSHPLLYAELVEKATKLLFQTLFYIQDNGTTCQFSIRHENKAPEFVIVGKSHSYDNGWHAKVEQPDNKVVLDKQIRFNERWQNEGQYFLTFDNYETSFFFHSNNTTNGIDTMPVYSDKYFTLDVSQSDRFKTCLKFNRWMNKTLDTVVTCRTFQTASDSTCSGLAT